MPRLIAATFVSARAALTAVDELPPPNPDAAPAADARMVEGLVLPYGEVGLTSIGPMTVPAGAVASGLLRLPDDLSQVKLLAGHTAFDGTATSIGYGVAAEERPDGLWMRFALGTTEAADDGYQGVEEHTNDGFSIELATATLDEAGNLLDGDLAAVAQVPVPAFNSARIAALAASLHGRPAVRHMEGTRNMPPENPTTPAATSSAPAAAAASSAPAAPATAALEPAATAAQVAAPPAGPAAAPAGLPTEHRTNDRVNLGASRREVVAALHRVVRGVSRPEAEAALQDIVNTDVFEVVGESSYAGQLTLNASFVRRFVPLLRAGNLTSWQVKGWRWGVKPATADYAGDKADVPSNAATVVPATTEAARIAGGHDLDRKFRDFGDTEFLDAYFEAMTESYLKNSDAKALAFILASASTPAGNATAAGGNVVDGALLAGDLLEDATDGMVPDYYLVNRTDRRALGSLTENDRLAYLDVFGLDLRKMIPSASVPAGTVVAGVKGAGTFYELPGSPVRVEAIDIARGGIDEALFGYWAALLHDSNGIVKATLTP